MSLRRTLITTTVLLLAHELLVRGLDRLDLIERLLSPGLDALVALPFALALYAIRLVLLFIAPSAVAIAAIRELGTKTYGKRSPAKDEARLPPSGTSGAP